MISMKTNPLEEKLAKAQKKMEQAEHKQNLKINREKNIQSKIDCRRKIIIGEIFIKYFPIVLNFTSVISTKNEESEFEMLDNFVAALAECQRLYQEMEDTLLSRMDK